MFCAGTVFRPEDKRSANETRAGTRDRATGYLAQEYVIVPLICLRLFEFIVSLLWTRDSLFRQANTCRNHVFLSEFQRPAERCVPSNLPLQFYLLKWITYTWYSRQIIRQISLATSPGCFEKKDELCAKVGNSLINTVPYAANGYVGLSAAKCHSIPHWKPPLTLILLEIPHSHIHYKLTFRTSERLCEKIGDIFWSRDVIHHDHFLIGYKDEWRDIWYRYVWLYNDLPPCHPQFLVPSDRPQGSRLMLMEYRVLERIVFRRWSPLMHLR